MTREPGALLLDEPTANLDGGTTTKVESWLLNRIAARRMPALWVAHDMAQVTRVAHRHLRVNGDRVEEMPCR